LIGARCVSDGDVSVGWIAWWIRLLSTVAISAF
jgi:hypothetical protein